VLIVVVGLAVFLMSWKWTDAPLPTGEGFNVVLISLDTTRADHLGCFGHPTVKTPNIDRLASLGTTFTQCASSVPITLPAHASIMTGTYPFVHGVRDNGTFQLQSENTTIAEVMSEAGYISGAVVGAHVLNREFGIDQGFALYNDIHDAREPINPRTGKMTTERSAAEIVDVAIGWLNDNATRKFFLFVHLFDPHRPYEPPEPYASRYEDPYVGEIAYVDEQIGRLLDFVTASGLDGNTLVVLTADHGEGRGDHQEMTHGNFIYDTTTGTPLILRCNGRIPAGNRITAQVRSIDVMPTILSFVGLDPPEPCQGINLMKLVLADAEDPGLTAYSETMLPMYNYGYAHMLSLRAGGWKYIHAPRPELYHVSVDPDEQRNLASAEPGRVASMRDTIEAFLEHSPQIGAANDSHVQQSQREIEALRSLGYLGSEPTDDALSIEDLASLLEPVGEDPKDHTEEIRLTTDALDLVAQQHWPEAERVLRELVDRFPESQEGFSWAYTKLGWLITRRKGDLEEAIGYLRKAIQFHPDNGEAFGSLGAALHMNGQIEEAVQAYEAALRCGHDTARVHGNLALSLNLLGRAEEAEAHRRKARQIEDKG